eukprot:gene29649-189_t
MYQPPGEGYHPVAEDKGLEDAVLFGRCAQPSKTRRATITMGKETFSLQ